MAEITCLTCGTTFRTSGGWGYGWKAGYAKHVNRCEKATSEERLYYAKHRRWPRKKKGRRSCDKQDAADE